MGEQMSERESLARAIADVEVMKHPSMGLPVFLTSEAAEKVADAALAWFAEYRGPRVVPSAEAVQAVVARIVAPYVSGPLDPLDVKVTDAVLALYASQPTVAQVREQAARDALHAGLTHGELHVLLESGDRDNGYAAGYQAGRRAAALAVRTETKGGE